MIVTPAVKEAFLRLARASRDLGPNTLLPSSIPPQIMMHQVDELRPKTRLDIALGQEPFTPGRNQGMEPMHVLSNSREEQEAIERITTELEERLDRLQAKRELPVQQQSASAATIGQKRQEQLKFVKNRILLYELKSELAGVERIFAGIAAKGLASPSLQKLFSGRIRQLHLNISKKMAGSG